MLTIILSACLVADPGQCRDHRIPAENIVDPTRCVMTAQPFVAKWADEHPLWEVKKYICRPTAENEG
ncbi:MAG: hypothetical protein SH859_09650 [Hyphomicrobium aestuarii]|jgi:hypothetical protein|nr:hypothetical protein [Hyphomicrobium aestuarii]